MNKSRNNGKGETRLQGSELLEKIRALAFVKVELELYLDTHPNCKVALDYYYQTLEALADMTSLYEATVGPLTAAGNVNTESWDWVKGPWPWQRADENTINGQEGA